ncbi:CoB--CoM heterodisulfide reductase iron-sulfur subunit B family protein [Calderihabitans maritimus]|uniref:Heterodisulfide reductase subunit B n=1 Tax=Calderihabitans maritimus TaxID=1246530 RepID=A0A1Z5HR04_9FIRM|nr:CoB--CoM heterodisulfide reductase iron-sulfur subunit B family protein [Calderihabitans maritimus]GAW91751.1 heterodisulfide reductase subunit B [Calderihabitans maritimus]
MKYNYLPGCSLHGSAKEYLLSFLRVSRKLGFQLYELSDWNCCGATAAKSIDSEWTLLLGARNLALAERKSDVLLVPCNLCYHNLAITATALRESEVRAEINRKLQLVGLYFQGKVQVKHPLELLVSEQVLEIISSQITRSLSGLRVMAYYGCLLTRPKEVALQGETNYSPRMLDKLINILGATPVPFSAKTKCCGGTLFLSSPNVAYGASRKILDEALRQEPDCLVVTCPMCHMMLDGKQTEIERTHQVKYRIPVLYFTQLIGLALGLSPKSLGLTYHVVSTRKITSR